MSSAAVAYPLDPSPEPLFRLSIRQYHAMIDAGVLNDDDPVELIEGILVYKVPKKPRHRIALAKLQRSITPLLPSDVSLQTQEPITLSDGEPEPDAAVFHSGRIDPPLSFGLAHAACLGFSAFTICTVAFERFSV
jgi:hypothetical protein